jgi:hypothetical protein
MLPIQRVIVEVELDDPNPENALDWLTQHRFRRVSGFMMAEVSESLESMDPTVSSDLINKIHAHFAFAASSGKVAATRLSQAIGSDMVTGVAIDGEWLPTGDWLG